MKRGTANRPNGQPLWGEELYEGGKARQARLQADFDEIRNVVDLPDPATSGGHAYIAAAGDSFEVFTANESKPTSEVTSKSAAKKKSRARTKVASTQPPRSHKKRDLARE